MKKFIIALLLVLIVFSISSCDLLGGGFFLPDYIGEWTGEQSETIITYTFAREEWEILVQTEILGTMCDVRAERGTMVNDDGKLTMTTTHEKEGDEVWIIIAPDTEWTEVAAEDSDSGGVISWSVTGTELSLTIPPVNEGGDPQILVLTKVIETTD